MGMVGTVRGVFTLVGAGIAGLLIWVSTQIGQGTLGGYWAVYGILAGAGLTMALSRRPHAWRSRLPYRRPSAPLGTNSRPASNRFLRRQRGSGKNSTSRSVP